MLKTELRKIYKEKRKTLSHDEVLLLSEKIIEKFILQFKLNENQKVHVFLTISKLKEIETKFLIDYCFKNKIRVFVPKVFGKKMETVEIFPETKFTGNGWGISEPENNEFSTEKDFDFVITPLLYCDHFGNRIGYGKGFYDDFFNNISAKSKKIGVNFFPPNEKIDDVFENDIPLDYLVLPTDMLSFGDLEGKSTK